MFSRLLALFVIVPAVELYLLVRIGYIIGAPSTLLLILATGLLGSYLTKSQGLRIWKAFQSRLAAGQIPGDELIDGVIILVSGAFLVTPGVVTDFVGLLGLFPLTRSFIKTRLRRYFLVNPIQTVSFRTSTLHFGGNPDGRTTRQSSPESDNQEPEIIVGGHAKNHPSSDRHDVM